MTLRSGLRLGPYEILAPIGAGFQGQVYRARDTRLQREVAIKVPPDHLADDPEALARFEREGRAIAALSHPNILEIHDIGCDGGVTFVVTELLKGETLRQRISTGALSWRTAAEIGLAVAEGLAAAHGCEVVHRDLKPENVFLTTDGRVKILDFGLARHEKEKRAGSRESTDSTRTDTESGYLAGTPGYMSPEYLRGRRPDARSDIFALGCVIYEMVTGRRAFSGEGSQEVLAATLRDEPPDPAGIVADLPDDLRMILMRSLAKEPEARFQSARDLAFALKLAVNSPVRHDPDRPVEPWPRPPSRWPRIVAAAVVVALAAGGAISLFSRSSGPLDSVAVLPFANAGGDPNTEYLSDGLTDTLIEDLSKLPNVRVMAWTTVMQSRAKTAVQAGRDLDVRAVVTGRVLRRGDRLIGQAELVEVKHGARLWGGQFDRDASDAFAVEEIAREISRSVRVKLKGEKESRPARSSSDPVAYDLYLKGRHQWNKRNFAGIGKSIGFFQQAAARDPNYAQAYAGLAGAYDLLAFYGIRPPMEVLPAARAAALRAIELDESIAEAHTSLAHVLYQFDWDFPGAEKEFRRAIALSPNDPNAHQWYSNFLAVCRRNEESFEQIRLARRLDPLNLITYADAGLAYYLAGQYDRSIEELRQSLELEPNFYLTHIDLGLAFAGKGLFEQAIDEAKIAMRLEPNDPIPISLYGHACARAGRVPDGDQALENLRLMSQKRFVSSFLFAFLYTGLGNKEKVLEWLEKAYEERAGLLVYLNVVRAFDPFRSEPRFQELVHRMKLPA